MHIKNISIIKREKYKKMWVCIFSWNDIVEVKMLFSSGFFLSLSVEWIFFCILIWIWSLFKMDQKFKFLNTYPLPSVFCNCNHQLSTYEIDFLNSIYNPLVFCVFYVVITIFLNANGGFFGNLKKPILIYVLKLIKEQHLSESIG